MRILVAHMSVTYTGRGHTELPRAVRILLLKDDGTVLIHAEKGTNPKNYMAAGTTVTRTRRGPQHLWTFTSKNGKETLQVRLHRILSDVDLHIDQQSSEPGLSRQGTESHLQAWIAQHPEALGQGFTIIAREHLTGAGAVDILARDGAGTYVAVELKRRAMLPSVDQVLRYVNALNNAGEHGTVRGMIAALDIRPNTAALAADRGVECITIPADWQNTEQ